jgi:hypothetical protein
MEPPAAFDNSNICNQPNPDKHRSRWQRLPVHGKDCANLADLVRLPATQHSSCLRRDCNFPSELIGLSVDTLSAACSTMLAADVLNKMASSPGALLLRQP